MSHPSDANGFYTFNAWPPPDNGGVGVFGDGTGPGVATYMVTIPGGNCRDAQQTTVTSNRMSIVNLEVKANYMEEPSIRSCPAEGKPINIATGNMFLDQTDIKLSTTGADLEFVRSYNSQLAYRNVSSGFGPGWSHIYNQKLAFPAAGIIMLRQGDGVPTYFQDIDANLTYEASVPFTKESWIEKQANGTYIRRLRKGGYETYDSAGRLTSLVDAFGTTTTLGYSSGKLTSIDAPGSRSLTLAYNASNRIESLAGPAGLIATYTYDASGRLVKVAYADDRGYTFTYDSNHQLLTTADLSGKVLETHTYSGTQAITSEISAGVEKYTLSYSPLQTTVTDALGNVTTYDWTNIWGMKFVTKITGPCASCSGGGNQTRSWTYDDKGRVLSYTDGKGNKTTYVYDANGDLISETDPDGNVTTYAVGPDGLRTSTTVKSVVDPVRSKVTTYEYDRGNLKSQAERGLLGDSSAYAYTTTYAYHANGKLASIDGPRTDVADVTTFEYDPQTGDLISTTQPHAGTTTYSNFTPLGQPQSVTDPNSAVTTYQYDPQQRVISMTVGGDTTRYEYTPSGKLGKITLPRLNSNTFIYDTYNQLVAAQDALGNSVQYTYNLMGWRTREEILGEATWDWFQVYLPLVQRAAGNLSSNSSASAAEPANVVVHKWQIFEYDGLYRLKKIINPDGSFTEYGYDGASNRTSLTNPRGYTTTYQYDNLNRMIAVVQPGTITTTYTYDAHSNPTSVTDPKGHLTTYFYDDMGRIYRQVSPDTGTTTYTYDAAGNRVTKTDARGITVGYEYDALNRPIRINFPTDADIVYTYDTCPNGKGRLCRVVDQGGTTSYTYSIKGELLQESKTIAGVTYVTGYRYDPNSNLTSVTYPSGRTVTYTFDLADRVMSVTTTPPGGLAQMLASNVLYKPYGEISSLTYGNGLRRTVSYDTQYRITAIQSGSIQRLTYSHDLDGDITAIYNLVDPARNKTFDYDALDRLHAATGPWGSLAWTYDGVGNRLTQSGSAGASTFSYQPGTNRLTGVSGPSPKTFSYDLSGNTTAENARGYVYNENGRLVRATEGSTTLGQYAYNANEQRVAKTASGATTVFHFDQQGQLIAETRADGSLVAEYINLNGQPLARAAGAMLAYIHTDHLGTPLAMTDAGGAKVWEIEARPFGDGAAISGSATLNLRFPGQYLDQETGLDQNWYREYNPGVGRYNEPDPIGSLGERLYRARSYDHRIGRFVSEQPVGLEEGVNFYAYVRNSPVNLVDPLGLQWGSGSGCEHTAEIVWHECMYECKFKSDSATCEAGCTEIKDRLLRKCREDIEDITELGKCITKAQRGYFGFFKKDPKEVSKEILKCACLIPEFKDKYKPLCECIQ